MSNYDINQWSIIENKFNPRTNKISESIMSLGNGHMGLRGNFEEDFSGNSLQGTYIAGVYYPDKTRVGWWKNGYPEYFAKVLNSINYIGIKILLNGDNLDISKYNLESFSRILNMREGFLERIFTVADKNGNRTKIETKRFLSMNQTEIAAIEYKVTPINHNASITFIPYLDGDVSNEDSNYNEKFWIEIDKDINRDCSYLALKTKKLDFIISAAMKFDIYKNNNKLKIAKDIFCSNKYIENKFTVDVNKRETTSLYKYIAVTSNRYYDDNKVIEASIHSVLDAYNKGFHNLFVEHTKKWDKIWQESDIVIDGDIKAQLGIRFNIFHLNQTYTGDDARLNIGPKGFTGEKYGGSTYWDTEAYCLPFYLSTHEEKIAKNLLIYRYNHLEKAKENAKKLRLKGALYPMVTINGEECHNEWEITFEEIHRNAAISYAIFNYVNYTGDKKYIVDYGFEVLVETSRFWVSRVNFSEAKKKYVILGVTGPNEYENNVNNNWYTNTMACWNMHYALECAELLKSEYNKKFTELIKKLSLTTEELKTWKNIIDNMYYPEDKEEGIFLQQDGYLDKAQMFVKDLPKEDLPLNQNWSWDKILRSCFIKQADVLQGIYFLGNRYDIETKKKNFDFYEPKTVHESSLSSCIHSIIASELGYEEKAYELYLRAARLDLDNYNNDTDDGLHITSMAGSWMAIVQGFGRMKVIDGKLNFNPFIPKAWNKYSFNVMFRGHLIKLLVDKNRITITQIQGEQFTVFIHNKEYSIPINSTITI